MVVNSPVNNIATAQKSGGQFKRARGAQPGNRNRLRSGLSSYALPKGCSGIHRSINEFRRSLEALVVEDRGEVSPLDAAYINSAVRWEQHAALASRWLRISFAELNHDQRLAHSREIARASSERDKALRELRIDGTAVKDAQKMAEPDYKLFVDPATPPAPQASPQAAPDAPSIQPLTESTPQPSGDAGQGGSSP